MKPFSLDTVLRYRKQMEDKAISRLVEAENNRMIIETKLRDKKKIYHYLITALAKLQSQGIDVSELIRYDERILYIQTQITGLEEKLHDAKELIVKARGYVLTKSKEKKIMEKLRDKQNLAWKQYLAKKEAAQLDEIAVMSHDRKNN